MKKKSVLVLVLALIAVISVSAIFSRAGERASARDLISVSTETPVNTYYINTESDLESFFSACNSSTAGLVVTENDGTTHIARNKWVLTNDIYLSRKSAEYGEFSNWQARYFWGEFDGQGHSIVGFEIDTIALNEAHINDEIYTESPAFFAYLGETAYVHDVNFVDAKIKSNGNASLNSNGEIRYNYDGNASIVANTNLGVIDNVKVQGSIEARGFIGGIALVNFGTIKNSLAIIDVTCEIGESTGIGGAGAIVAINHSKPDVMGDIEYVGVVTAGLIENCHYVMNAQNDATLEWVNGVQEKGQSLYGEEIAPSVPENSTTNSEFSGEFDTSSTGTLVKPTEANYVSDGKVEDYFDVTWALEYYLEDSTNYVQANEINLFNVEISSERKDYLVGNGDGRYSRGYHGFYNAQKSGLDDISEYEVLEVSALPTASDSLLGDGSKNNPYLITSVADLLKIGEIEENAVNTNYYLLTNSICFIDYEIPADGYVINEFKGVFDGNNKAITGLKDTSLFNKISVINNFPSSATIVKNLYLRGEGSPKGLLARENNGAVSGITVCVTMDSDDAVGLVDTNNYTITRSTVYAYGQGIAVSRVGGGALRYVRNMSDLKFMTSTYSGSKEYLYNDNKNWGSSEIPLYSVAYDGTDYLPTVSSVYDLVKVTSVIDGKFYYSQGWKYAKETMWAFKAGTVQDIPVLVFPEDNVDYKFLTKFNGGGSDGDLFGSYNERTEVMFSTLLRSEDAWIDVSDDNEFGKEIKDDTIEEDELEIRANVSYNITATNPDGLVIYYEGIKNEDERVANSHSPRPISYEALNYVAKSNLGVEFNDIIDELGIDLLWSFKAKGASQASAVPASDKYANRGEGTYYFELPYNEYVDCRGSIEMVVVDGVYIGRFKSQTTIFAVNLDEIADTLGVKIEGTTLTYSYNGLPYNEKYAFNVGTYVMSASIAATEINTASSAIATYTITKGNLDVKDDKCDFRKVYSSIGGNENTVENPTPHIYNGENYNPTDFTMEDFDLPGMTISVKSVIWTSPDGIVTNSVSVGNYRNAGKYTFTLLFSRANYEDVEVSGVEFYIAPKNIEISANISALNKEIRYGESLPEVNMSTIGVFGGDQITGYTISSEYIPFASGVGTYEVVYVKSGKINQNYNVVINNSTTFEVVKADFDVSNALEDMTVTYDGSAYALVADTTKVVMLSGDDKVYDYAIEYSLGALKQEAPIEVIDAGSYAVTLSVTASENYNVAKVTKTLTIKRLAIKIVADDKEIMFGEEATGLTYKAVRMSDGLGDYTSEIIEGITLAPDGYVVGEAGSVLNAEETAYLYVIKVSMVGGNYGINYFLEAIQNATLTVNKYTPNATLVNSTFVYDGNAINTRITFTDDAEYEYLGWYTVKNDVETPLAGAPKNANYNDVYRLYVRVESSAKYVALSSAYVDFYIGKADLTSEINLKYASGALNGIVNKEGMSVVYNGEKYLLTIDKSTLPSGEEFNVRYQIGMEEVDELSIKDVGSINDFSISLMGNGNYNILKLSYESFSVSPKVINVQFDNNNAQYTSFEITPNIVLADGSSLFDGESVDFSYTVSGDKSILYPDTYVLSVVSLNDNYVVGNSSVEFSVTYATVEVDLSDVDTFEFVYRDTFVKIGNRYSFKDVVSVTMGGIESEQELTFVIDSTSAILAVGSYNIYSIENLTKDSVKLAEFSVINGENKVNIAKRALTFEWELNDSYVYSGYELQYVELIDKEKITPVGTNIKDAYKISFTPNATPKDVGEYTFTATLDVTNSANYYIASATTKVVNITPAELEISVVNKNITVTSSVPTSYEISYPNPDKALLNEDSIEYFFATDYTVNSPAGSYDVVVTTNSTNYTLTKVSEKELIVANFTFDSVTVGALTAVYTGEKIEVTLNNLPVGTSVTYSSDIVNAGTHNVIITLTKTNYNTREIPVEFVVQKGTPIVVPSTDTLRVKIVKDYVLTGEQVVATASFNSLPITGVYSYPQGTELELGIKTYAFIFTPDDENLNVVGGLQMTIEGYIDMQDVIFDYGQDNENVETSVNGDTISVEATDIYEIKLDFVDKDDYMGFVIMYVNGTPCYSGYYAVEEDEDVTVEYKVGETVLYSQKFSVNINKSVVEPDTPSTPSTPSTPNPDNGEVNGGSGEINVEVDEENKQKLIIIGASVGGGVALIAIIIVIVVVIKKKKEGSSGTK